MNNSVTPTGEGLGGGLTIMAVFGAIFLFWYHPLWFFGVAGAGLLIWQITGAWPTGNPEKPEPTDPRSPGFLLLCRIGLALLIVLGISTLFGK